MAAKLPRCIQCNTAIRGRGYKIQLVRKKQTGNAFKRVFHWHALKTVWLCSLCWDNYIKLEEYDESLS